MLSWVVWGLGSHRLDMRSGDLLLVLFLGFFFPILSDLSKFPSSFCDHDGSFYFGVKFCPFRIHMSRSESVEFLQRGDLQVYRGALLKTCYLSLILWLFLYSGLKNRCNVWQFWSGCNVALDRVRIMLSVGGVK